MSVLKRIAAWLDPEAAAARDENKNVILAQQDAINEMTTKITELSNANDNLISALSKAGLRSSARSEALKKLLAEAAIARAYVIDVIDDIDDQLAATKAKKKTVELETVRAAVAADLVKINVAIDEASKVLP